MTCLRELHARGLAHVEHIRLLSNSRWPAPSCTLQDYLDQGHETQEGKVRWLVQWWIHGSTRALGTRREVGMLRKENDGSL